MINEFFVNAPKMKQWV